MKRKKQTFAQYQKAHKYPDKDLAQYPDFELMDELLRRDLRVRRQKDMAAFERACGTAD